MTGTVDPPVAGFALSRVVIPLLKGVVYREHDDALWNGLIHGQARVRDYVAVLGLELMLDEAEGYAFLRARPDDEAPLKAETGGDTVPEGSRLPRLVVRRPLSFHVSLLLALLRRKLAEIDAGGATPVWCSPATRSWRWYGCFCPTPATRRGSSIGSTRI